MLAVSAVMAFAIVRSQFDDSMIVVDRPPGADGSPLWVMGIPYLLFWFAVWPLAALVYLARPDRLQNRLLALALAFDGLFFLQVALALMQEIFGLGARDVWSVRVAARAVFPLAMVSYLAFLGTLDTPISRVLGTRTARTVLFGAGLLGAWFTIASPRSVLPGVLWLEAIGRWDAVPTEPIDIWANLYGFIAVWLYGLAVVVTLLVRAPRGSKLRSQAKIYVGAFGARDVGMVLAFTAISFLISGVIPSTMTWHIAISSFEIIGFLSMIILLPYGLLKYQLFEIDLKIKWTLSRGTAMALLAGVFFLVKEGIEFFVPGESLVASLAGAAAVAVLLLPAWHLARRLHDRIMPKVRDTEEYRTVRKRELYEAAVESAMKDGIVTDKERDMLTTLVERLGIDTDEAQGIERAVAARMDAAG